MIKLLFFATSLPLIAETVILTTVPDDERPLEPITSLGGLPLDAGAQVRLGGFPGMDDGALLDAATAGGVATAFVPFGAVATVGQGVDGVAGGFEVSFRDVDADGLAGEVISLMVEADDGEFLIARFPGETFSTTSDTGLEPLRTLHLADADLVVGSRIGEAMLSTSPPPATGSYASWIAGFPSITDPAMREPDADADGDGRSNFLEYATGGDPTKPGDAPACEIVPDGAGGFWVRFRRVPGLGTVRYIPQSSHDLLEKWNDDSERVAPDPDDSAVLRLHLNAPFPSHEFFRLHVE